MHKLHIPSDGATGCSGGHHGQYSWRPGINQSQYAGVIEDFTGLGKTHPASDQTMVRSAKWEIVIGLAKIKVADKKWGGTLLHVKGHFSGILHCNWKLLGGLSNFNGRDSLGGKAGNDLSFNLTILQQLPFDLDDRPARG